MNWLVLLITLQMAHAQYQNAPRTLPYLRPTQGQGLGQSNFNTRPFFSSSPATLPYNRSSSGSLFGGSQFGGSQFSLFRQPPPPRYMQPFTGNNNSGGGFGSLISSLLSSLFGGNSNGGGLFSRLFSSPANAAPRANTNTTAITDDYLPPVAVGDTQPLAPAPQATNDAWDPTAAPDFTAPAAPVAQPPVAVEPPPIDAVTPPARLTGGDGQVPADYLPPEPTSGRSDTARTDGGSNFQPQVIAPRSPRDSAVTTVPDTTVTPRERLQLRARNNAERTAMNAPVWPTFIKLFQQCAPGCVPTNFNAYRDEDGSCHKNGHAVDVLAMNCNGHMVRAADEINGHRPPYGKFNEMVTCVQRLGARNQPKMSVLWHQTHGRGNTQDHWDHGHFSIGCYGTHI